MLVGYKVQVYLMREEIPQGMNILEQGLSVHFGNWLLHLQFTFRGLFKKKLLSTITKENNLITIIYTH